MLCMFLNIKVIHKRINIIIITTFINRKIPIICERDKIDLPFEYTYYYSLGVEKRYNMGSLLWKNIFCFGV